jgi:hypothetical protein
MSKMKFTSDNRESVVLQLPIKVICQFVQIQGIFSEALICM